MKVFDMDSHLREEYLLDEVYRLEGKFADQSPVRLNDEKNVRAKFKHNLQPWPKQVRKHFNHSIVYDPYENWNGGEIARRQVGGWDMKARLAENEKEGIDHQMLFPTQLSIPTYIEGELGAALARAYNNWVKKLVAGNKDMARTLVEALKHQGKPELVSPTKNDLFTPVRVKEALLVEANHAGRVVGPAGVL